MGVQDSLLPTVAAVVVTLGSLALRVSAVNCTLGKESHIPVSNGATVDLRQGETLILNCKGEPNGIGEHFTMDGYTGTTGLIRKNEATLNYKWYIEASVAGSVRVYLYDNTDNSTLKFELAIRVHNLSSLIDKPTPGPCTCTSMSPEQTALPTDQQVPHPEDVGSTGFQQSPPNVARAVESHTPYIVGVSILLVVLLCVLCIVCIMMYYCRKRQRNKALQVENGQSPHLRDSRGESIVQNTSLASSSSDQDVFSDHDTATEHLN